MPAQSRLSESTGVREAATSEQGTFRFAFKVSGGKLESRDKQVLSEVFYILMGDVSVPFKVQVVAKQVHRHKHGQCFRTARGRGRLELKCQGLPPHSAPALAFAFSIGAGERAERPRGPVLHNFGNSSVGGLPVDTAEWDFKAAVDPGSASCPITLEVMPPHKASSPQVGPHLAHAGTPGEPSADDLSSFSPGGHLSTIAEDPPEAGG